VITVRVNDNVDYVSNIYLISIVIFKYLSPTTEHTNNHTNKHEFETANSTFRQAIGYYCAVISKCGVRDGLGARGSSTGKKVHY